MTYRVRNIIIAAVLALTAAMLALFYVANYKRHVQHSESTVAVFVAKGDIPVGTSGADILKHHMLTSSQVVQRTIVPGAISNADQVQNLVTTAPIYSGEQVTLRRFANHVELGPRAQLHGTLRAHLARKAIRHSCSPARSSRATTSTCSRRWRYCGTDTCIVSRDVARNLLVLQAPDGATSKLGTSQTTSIMLAASDRHDAQKVWWAAKNSIGWTLVLRPVSNATDSPEDAESTGSMTVDGLNPVKYQPLQPGRCKVSTETQQINPTRVFFTGDCDGFVNLRESLADHPAIESSARATTSRKLPALSPAVTSMSSSTPRDESSFPASEIAAIREHTRAPVIVVASNEAADLLNGAMDADVADVLLLPQLVENVVFTIRKTAHVKRATSAVKRCHTRTRRDRVLAQGRHRQDGRPRRISRRRWPSTCRSARC